MRLHHSLGLLMILTFGCLPSETAPPHAQVVESETLAALPAFMTPDLAAWEAIGGKAEYRFLDGVLSGRGASRGNAFLRSRKEFGDFELKCSVRIQPEGNSGIQIRSHVRESGKVFGYQIEIDPSDRSWSGGLFDEGREGWLVSLEGNEKARATFKVGEWNAFRIECRGSRIRTWVNEVPCVDWNEAKDLSGFIAFQVHSGGRTKVDWKDFRFKEFLG